MTVTAPRVSALQSTSAAPSALLRFGAYTFPPLLARRLAAEHGWTDAHTAVVLAEYRRFLQLAAFSGQSVTPSRLVDEAWHEHLTLTRDYWERLCGEVLGQPVHHEPRQDEPDRDESSRGEAGAAGLAATPSAYLATLDLYTRTFGEAPSQNLWPDPRLSPLVLPAAPRRLVGSARLRFLIFLGLVLGGGLIWHGTGIFIGFLLGLAVLLSGLARGRGRARSGGGDDGAALSFAGLSFMDSGTDGSGCSDGGSGSDGGGSSCGSSCSSGCGS